MMARWAFQYMLMYCWRHNIVTSHHSIWRHKTSTAITSNIQYPAKINDQSTPCHRYGRARNSRCRASYIHCLYSQQTFANQPMLSQRCAGTCPVSASYQTIVGYCGNESCTQPQIFGQSWVSASSGISHWVSELRGTRFLTWTECTIT